ACGPEEEIVGMSVRDRYLVGKLAPRVGLEDGNFIEGLQGPTADVESTGDMKLIDLKPFEEENTGAKKAARRRLPGEEFSTACGASDPEDEDTSTIDASKNQSFVPSSMGLTVCIDETTRKLEIEARWGRYYKTASEENFDDKGKPRRAWKRVASGGMLVVTLEDGLLHPIAPDADHPNVIIQGTIRPASAGSRMVTIFLVNNQSELQQNQDEAWLFQPQLILRDVERQ